jgi:acetyl esterase/lipase
MKSRCVALIGILLACGFSELRGENPPTDSAGHPSLSRFEQAAGSTQPRLPFRIVRDVAYLGPDPPEKLDLYLPSPERQNSPAPAVIWMHGNHHDKGDSREHNVCETLAGAGYVCASINYGTWTDSDNDPAAPARNRQNLANAKTAVRFLRVHAREYRIDPARIAAFGGSAGAYLALMLGLTNDDPEFSRLGAYEGVSSAVEAVGDFYGDYEPAMMARITSRFPPIFIAQGKIDPAVDYRQSVALAQAFADQAVPHEFILLENVGHAFDLTTWNRKPLRRDLRPLVLAFLGRFLGPAPRPADQ